MLRVGGSAGGAAPMGAAWGVAWGQGISPLLPVGSRPGMGEASDTDSGIMLHSGERWGRIWGGEGRSWSAPIPHMCSYSMSPPAENGGLQCMGPPWGHTNAPRGGDVEEMGDSPGFREGTQAWGGGPRPALTQPGFTQGWLSQGETFPMCRVCRPPPRWEITAASGEPEHPWVLLGG